MRFDLLVKTLDKEGRLGFDKYGQLWSWTKHDEDGNAEGRIIRDVRNCTCYICGRGWELTAESMRDQMRDGVHSMHGTCWYGYRKLTAKHEITDALIKAGFLFNLQEVDPRYPGSTPWQIVQVVCNDEDRTDSGYRIVLGRRKRVWELRLHINDTYLRGQLEVFFKDVKDTKGFEDGAHSKLDDPQLGAYYYVHAWSKDQLVEYLHRFHQIIPASIDRALV